MLVYKLHERLTPWMEQFVGWRMMLAQQNSSGFLGRPSFGKRFLVAESSDFSEVPSEEAQRAWLREHTPRGEQVQWLEPSKASQQREERRFLASLSAGPERKRRKKSNLDRLLEAMQSLEPAAAKALLEKLSNH